MKQAIEVQSTDNPNCNECKKLKEQIKQLIYSNQCKDIDIIELTQEIKLLKKKGAIELCLEPHFIIL